MGAVPAVFAVLIAAFFVLVDVGASSSQVPASTPPVGAGASSGERTLFAALEAGEVDAGLVPEQRKSAVVLLFSVTFVASVVFGVAIYLGLRALRG